MSTEGNVNSHLIGAIRSGSLINVVKALGEGCDIEMPDMHGYLGLPLRTACFEGNPSIVQELLRHGANPNAIASDGPGAPLRLALRKGHREIADLLLQAGAVFPDGFEWPFEASSRQAPTPMPAPSTRTPDSMSIEFESPGKPPPGDKAEAPGQFGTETRLLSMDLLFLDESENPIGAPPATEKR